MKTSGSEKRGRYLFRGFLAKQNVVKCPSRCELGYFLLGTFSFRLLEKKHGTRRLGFQRQAAQVKLG